MVQLYKKTQITKEDQEVYRYSYVYEKKVMLPLFRLTGWNSIQDLFAYFMLNTYMHVVSNAQCVA